MSKDTLQTVTALGASVGTQIVTTTQALPTPEDINNVAGLLTQLVILALTLWSKLKKPKPTK